ncbi:MAG: NHL repeat-containing protein, partial [Candidatus Latescibacterota bacterium]
MVQAVEVVKDLIDFTPGEVEFNGKMIPRAMQVMSDGVLFTSGWDGRIIRYDPKVKKPQDRFTAVGYIPSVPGRQYWNAIDEIIEHEGMLYMGASDGYIFRFNPRTNEIDNFGKPVSSVEVMGMTVSSLDGCIYGISGGGDQGVSRFWCLDPRKGTFDVDYPAVKVFNLKPMGDIVCTGDGTVVMAETERIANLWVLTPGASKGWEKSGVMPEPDPRIIVDSRKNLPAGDLFAGHKKLEVEVYPMPSSLHGGSGYTAIQADRNGRIYIGGAFYGKFSPLMQLDPKTAQWRLILRSDEFSHEYGRGQGIPGKIHTKLRLGADGKIYGAMKQGYEFHFDLRSDMGEAPYGKRGGQYPCHFFSYDPKTDRTEDLGPAYKQEGVVGFCADTKRGFLYGMTEPSGYFLAYDLKAGRFWNAGPWGGIASNRYMAMEMTTGRVYHKGEMTPAGKYFMTVWDPQEFRLRDYEVVTEDGLKYSHSYTLTSGAPGANKLYGTTDGKFFEMDMIPASDGKLHARPLCTWSVDGEPFGGFPYAIETGPDGRIYWCNLYNNGGGPVPMSLFAWDPKTRTKSYLGTCALGGEFIRGGATQGLCFDSKGNLGIHVLYASITPAQQKFWKVSRDFSYKDIQEQPYYISYPGHIKGTYYAVYYVKNATKIK